MGNHLIPLEFEDVGSVPVVRLLDGAGCAVEKLLSVRQLGEKAGQVLPDRWKAGVCGHQLLLQLTNTPQYWKNNSETQAITS